MLIEKRTNRRNYTNFERNLAMMVIYLPVRFVFELESGNGNFDEQTDKRMGGTTPILKGT